MDGGLSGTASVIAVLQLTSKVIEYLHDVKNAPQEWRRCTVEASNLHNLLTNLRYRLEDTTKDDPWYTAFHALDVKNGPLDQYKMVLEQLLGKISKQNTKQRLMWKFNKTEVEGIIQQMERLKSLVSIALELDHFQLSEAIKRDSVLVRTAMPGLQAGMTEITDALPALQSNLAAIQNEQLVQAELQKLKQHEAALQWLSPSDFAAQQHDRIAAKEDGTGRWFLESAEFGAWQRGSTRTLFCPGIPGAGKTMIAAMAVDHLSTRAQTEDIGVAFLFFDYKGQLDQNLSDMFAAILKQLAQARSDTAAIVLQMYEKHLKQRSRPSLNEILTTLKDVASAYPVVYIVVDALDECTTRDGTRLRFIENLCQSQRQGNIRLMFTSRHVSEVEEKFTADCTVLEVRASDQDVRRYLAGQLYRLPKCILNDKELAADVVNQIAEAVDGMFLLARLHLDSLLDKKRGKMVKIMLHGLKKGAEALNSAYDDAIKRIEAQLSGDTLLAKQALSWITYAQRPLSIKEFCQALAIEVGEKTIDPDMLCDIGDVSSVCAGLLAVDKESGIVRLVHYTTQEYFERIRGEWLPGAQLHIASACITYLTMDTFLSGGCDNDEAYEARMGKNVLLGYAAHHWATHTDPIQREVSGLALAFLLNDALVDTATQALFVRVRINVRLEDIVTKRGYSQRYPKAASGVHLVAKHGLAQLADALFEYLDDSTPGKAWVDVEDTDRRTPLSWAAESGNESMVRYLLDRKDVRADSKDKMKRTPLSWAAQCGHENIVQILLDRRDVEADLKCQYGRTPLVWATKFGHLDVVRLLIEREDVDVNAEDKNGQTALIWATGHEDIVRLLLKREDVDLDVKDKMNFTPLDWTQRRGHEKVGKMLMRAKLRKEYAQLGESSP